MPANSSGTRTGSSAAATSARGRPFRLLEIQFNLAYEVSTPRLCSFAPNCNGRCFVLWSPCCNLVIWLLFTNKDGLKDYNIWITYTLLVGAIAVDVFAFLRIQLWSDWTVAQPNKRDPIPSKKSFHNMILSARRRTWGRYKRREDPPMWACFRRALFRRWSELCLSERSNKVIEFFGVGDGIEQRKYVSNKWFSNHLRDFIFEDLKAKVRTRGGIENIGRVKGGWACVCLMSNYQIEMISIPHVRKLLDVRGEYDMILMRRHIITELCYHGDHLSHDADDNLVYRLVTRLLPIGNKPNNNAGTKTAENKKLNQGECSYRKICKTLSDYLMYLLIHQQDMMSLPAKKSAWRYLACRFIREKFTEGDFRSHQAHIFPIDQILSDLGELEEKKIGKWEFMAKVWGELLYYAAIRCKPDLHAAKLKQGGELLSFVWLFLVQMGFGLHESELKHEELEPEKALLHTSVTEGCMSPRQF